MFFFVDSKQNIFSSSLPLATVAITLRQQKKILSARSKAQAWLILVVQGQIGL